MHEDREIAILAKMTNTPYREVERLLQEDLDLSKTVIKLKGGKTMNYTVKQAFAKKLDDARGEINDAWSNSREVDQSIDIIETSISNLREELDDLESAFHTLREENENTTNSTDQAGDLLNDLMEAFENTSFGIELTTDEKNDLHRAMMTLSRIANKILDADA